MAAEPTTSTTAPREDFRVAAARKTLAESAAANGTDPAYNGSKWHGRVEVAALGLLAVIDEGTHIARTPDLDSLSDDELADQLEAEIGIMRPRLDEMERCLERRLERRS